MSANTAIFIINVVLWTATLTLLFLLVWGDAHKYYYRHNMDISGRNVHNYGCVSF